MPTPSAWVTNEQFVADYGATQAVPGPLFTFAAYLGAAMKPLGGGLAGAALALLAFWKCPPWLVVTLSAVGGAILARL